MPRKKTAEVPGQVAHVICPGCTCVISSDGQTLHQKSEQYLEWLKTAEVLGTLEAKFKEMEGLLENSEKELAAAVSAKENLAAQLKEANASVEVLKGRLEKKDVGNLGEKREGNKSGARVRDEDEG